MRPKFISAMYFEGRILMFEEYGDVYEYCLGTGMVPWWTLLSASPWPSPTPYDKPAEVK